jgi:cell wall assembly regulator SMI1
VLAGPCDEMQYWDGAGNHHVLDLAPARGGVRGQAVSFWHDDGSRTLVAMARGGEVGHGRSRIAGATPEARRRVLSGQTHDPLNH